VWRLTRLCWLFRCQLSLQGLSAGRIVMSAVIDPRTSIPMSVVNIAVKQIIGMKVYLIQQTAKKMGRDAQVMVDH
jgi:hypothetical protein